MAGQQARQLSAQPLGRYTSAMTKKALALLILCSFSLLGDAFSELGADLEAYVRRHYLKEPEGVSRFYHVAVNRHRSLVNPEEIDLTRQLVTDPMFGECRYQISLKGGIYCWKSRYGEPMRVAAVHQPESPELNRARELVHTLGPRELQPLADAILYTTYLRAKDFECASYRLDHIDMPPEQFEFKDSYSSRNHFVSAFACLADGKPVVPPWRPEPLEKASHRAFREVWDFFRHESHRYVLVRTTTYSGEDQSFELLRLEERGLVRVLAVSISGP